MDIGLEKLSPFSLSWDFIGRNRKEGTFEELCFEYLDKFEIRFNIYIKVELVFDEGDYWHPPLATEVDKIVDIDYIELLDLDENQISLSEKETEELKTQLIELVTYE